MKVLHVYKSYYPDTVGGIEQVIAQLGRALGPLGVQNRIFTLSPQAQPPVLTRPEGEVHRARTTLEIASNPMSLPALAQFRAQVQWADVVHYQFPWPFGDLLHLCAGRSKPSVVSYQSDIVRQNRLMRVYEPLMRRFLGSVDRVVATSPQYLQTSEVLSCLRTPVDVISNGIDPAVYPQPSASCLARWLAQLGEGFLLFMGVLRYYKGLDTLLEAAVGFPGKIVIGGDGQLAGSLQASIQHLGLKNVHLIGRVDDEDKMALLHLARGFVFPSNLRSEAFGMSLVEAAMAAKPLISCEIGTGTSHVNAHLETGWVVPPHDALALRAAMQHFLDHPDQAAAYGQAARERFERLFTADRMAQSYHQLYQQLIEADPRRVGHRISRSLPLDPARR